MRKVRILLLTALTAVAALAAFTAYRAGWPIKLYQGPTGKDSTARVAKQLATKLALANTPKARYEALVSIMDTLLIPVFSATGNPIIHGGRRQTRFYLYDFELQIMSDALERKTAQRLSEIATTLARAGIKQSDRPLDAELLRQALLEGVRDSAQHPEDTLSLIPLLVRELGLGHKPPYDMLQEVLDQQLRFDALQTFLILYDVIAPTAPPAKSGMASSFFSGLRGAITPNPAAAEPCNDPSFQELKGIMPTGKWLLTLIKKLGAPIRAAGIFEDVIHMNILAAAVSIHSETSEEQETHYGPLGHRDDNSLGGKELRYTILLFMNLDLGDIVINCGPLFGVKFPRKGPISGVTIVWETAGVGGSPGLENYGTVTYDPSSKTTGSDGRSTLIFKPSTESVPGVGIPEKLFGSVHASALYQSAFANIPGGLLQFLDPKERIAHWNVACHFLNLNGRWKTDRGDEVVITQTGADVRAVFVSGAGCQWGGTRDYYIQGQLAGNTLRGTRQDCTGNKRLHDDCHLSDPATDKFEAAVDQDEIKGTFYPDYINYDQKDGHYINCRTTPGGGGATSFSLTRVSGPDSGKRCE